MSKKKNNEQCKKGGHTWDRVKRRCEICGRPMAGRIGENGFAKSISRNMLSTGPKFK